MKFTGFIFSIQETIRKINKDRLSDYSAQACYYILLSFMPFILVLLNILHYVPIEFKDFVDIFGNIIPGEFREFIITIITDIDNSSSVALLSVTAIGLLWSAGKGFMSIKKGLDQIYESKPKGNWLLQRMFSSIYALLFLLSIVASLILVVFGENLLKLFKTYLPNLRLLIAIMTGILDNKILLVPTLLTIFFALIYTFIPNRKRHLLEEIPGALLAAIGWYIFSQLYSLYVYYFPSHSYTYSSITTFILLLVWMYICIFILFMGAEFNSLIEKEIFRPWHISKISKIISRRRKNKDR
ncbi:MAG: YihY/virulence factor BrkB family protein [Eubacteriales bacterium]|nr:YihY/virulence factor BrkB family protein [Eubacteriales bacterium]